MIRLACQDMCGMRSDRDDWVHATVYWRIELNRFGGKGGIVGLENTPEPG